jgi:hypothetical protein
MVVLNEPMPEGLIVLASSGLGEKLEIPTECGTEVYTQTSNCLFFDHRTLADDIHDTVRLEVVEHAPEHAKEILKTTLETPTKALYVGDHERKKFQVVRVGNPVTEVRIFVASRPGVCVVSVTVK